MKRFFRIIGSLIIAGLCLTGIGTGAWIWTNITYDDEGVPTGGWEWYDDDTPGQTPTPTQPDYVPGYSSDKGKLLVTGSREIPNKISHVTVKEFSGNVTFVSPINPAQIKDVTNGTLLPDNCILVTGATSYAKIQMSDGTILTLPSSSTIIIGDSEVQFS